jgi:hypothetical protein
MRLWLRKSANDLRDTQYTDEEMLSMLPQDHLKVASSLKSRGKKAVKKDSCYDTLDSLTHAIALSPTPRLYFDRAICG